MDNLHTLADLVRQQNIITERIAQLIERPADIGHLGEYIAARIFGIQLHASASHKGSDGVFIRDALEGRSVNVKWYLKRDGLLDIAPHGGPDLYLVLAGPKTTAASSRHSSRPLQITQVFLFDSLSLHAALAARGTRLGTATSVPQALWDAAEIYPRQTNPLLQLSADQHALLALFDQGDG